MARAYILVLGERDAIAWVLRNQQMAFPATPRRDVARLEATDQLFLYATRSAWRNPRRDRGRIIGHATATTGVLKLDTPLEIRGNTYHSACSLRIEGIVPYPGGLELAPLVEQLAAFPKPHVWHTYLRRTLLALPPEDAELVRSKLHPLLQPATQAIGTYLQPASRR